MIYDKGSEAGVVIQQPDVNGTYNASDYSTWNNEKSFELIKGKPFKTTAFPSSAHQIVSARLLKQLFNAFEGKQLEVLHAPFTVYLVHNGEDYKQTQNIVTPDICVISNKSKLKTEGYVGAPDIIIEILSPETVRQDVDLKYSIYEEYGVKEYWVVHPLDHTVVINVLENGSYKTLRPLTAGQVLRFSAFPELTIELEEVFSGLDIED